MLRKYKVFSFLLVAVVAALFLASTSNDSMQEAKRDYIKTLWMQSGHADVSSEAFHHWDEDDPRAVSTSCAKCHSTEGLQQFLIDGSVHTAVDLNALEAAGKKNSIRCEACHTTDEGGPLRNASALKMPSGKEFEIKDNGAVCMQCHQGRESKASVDARIAGVPGIGDDTPSSKLSFRNIHYAAASASQLGTFAQSGYEYAGMSYDARFSHITGYNDCVTCHDPHTTHIREENCATCHTFSDPKQIRFKGSCVDYDGDGDKTEGIFYEIETIKEKVYAAFLAYTRDVVKKPAVYDPNTYPYFFNDTNGNGEADASEAAYGNRYTSFTPRSLRASFNFQFATKEPAAFAHGGKYMIELLYDTLTDLNMALGANPVSMAGMHRGDEGHFNGSSPAWRHWDGDGAVQTSCAKCHSATGLKELLETGTIAEEQPLSNGMLCTTCHSSPPSLISGAKNPVTFPSGAVLSMGDSSNLCMNCHQGRASKKTIDDKIAASAGPYTFTNVHYFAAGAVLFGTEAKGGYEYAGKSYAGKRNFANHVGKFTTCVECHMNTKGMCDDCGRAFCDHKCGKAQPCRVHPVSRV